MIATVLVGLGIAILIFVPLERIFPLRRDQRIFRRGWRTDTMHFLVTNQLVQLATIAVVFIPAVSLAVLVRPWLGPLVTSQPWELQLVEAIVIVAFGGYVGHRRVAHPQQAQCAVDGDVRFIAGEHRHPGRVP